MIAGAVHAAVHIGYTVALLAVLYVWSQWPRR